MHFNISPLFQKLPVQLLIQQRRNLKNTTKMGKMRLVDAGQSLKIKQFPHNFQYICAAFRCIRSVRRHIAW